MITTIDHAAHGARRPHAPGVDMAARQGAKTRLDALASFLDSAWRVPGTSFRFGADAALNVIPGLGPLIAKGLAGYLIWEARRLGVPTTTLMRMLGNVGVDFVIGVVPVIGWVGDAFFRANRKNMELLRRHLSEV